MAIALGVHVGDDEISAALVEADLPELGPISTRTVSVSSAPGGVGDAVTTMLGIMRVQAAQNDLLISGSGVVCDSIALCGTVRAALAAHDIHDVGVVDAGDPRLNSAVPSVIAAALIGAKAALAEPVAVPTATGEEDRSGSGSDVAGTPRSARLTMIGLGVAVLAALSGATVWALAASDPTQNSVVDTADVAEVPSSGDNEAASSAVVVADSAVPSTDPSAVPAVDTGLLEAPAYGPMPVGTWSAAPTAGSVPTPDVEASSGGGNSGRVDTGGVDAGAVDSGGGRPGGGNSGGGDSGGDSGGGDSGGDSGGEEPTTVDPPPEPEPETEVPSTDPAEPTTEVPEITEPTTDTEPPTDSVE
ncbi:hypothetical protein CH256_14880 [Rhodococcus sp. 05-2254-6]|uniref:hypothetical protein n=1 Tax=Rhodococcus sp. 05-2254-6 TaxID=2022489 RepID=UPI000B9BD002|nr:hypothetical protein [Rhodococcus sp. 05-2254-6]OZE30378.1 hypothetical protein CH256_14880 [Rhodococcus sp. 05-2254-6]